MIQRASAESLKQQKALMLLDHVIKTSNVPPCPNGCGKFSVKELEVKSGFRQVEGGRHVLNALNVFFCTNCYTPFDVRLEIDVDAAAIEPEEAPSQEAA